MKYLVEVFWSDEDEGYIAVAPDLPGARLSAERRRKRCARSASRPWPGSPPAARRRKRFQKKVPGTYRFQQGDSGGSDPRGIPKKSPS
jgi:hypothetical protein